MLAYNDIETRSESYFSKETILPIYQTETRSTKDFSFSMELKNPVTLQALEEIEEIRDRPGVATVDDLFAALGHDEGV